MNQPVALRRPAVRWFGGKWQLAPWIIAAFPTHETYVESFGGGASVLLRKPRSSTEIINDLDRDVVALYRVLADPILSRQLAWDCYLTPFRASVLADARRVPEDADDLTRARKLVTRGALAYNASIYINTGTGSGLRSTKPSSRRRGSPALDWSSYRRSVPAFHDRLRDVRISQRPAVDVMLEHDGAGVLHYVDPPYVPITRKSPGKGYRHEMSSADHSDLVEVLRSLRGYVVLSGYPNPVYDDGLNGWMRLDRTAVDNGRNKRTESVWLNPAAVEATQAPSLRQIALV